MNQIRIFLHYDDSFRVNRREIEYYRFINQIFSKHSMNSFIFESFYQNEFCRFLKSFKNDNLNFEIHRRNIFHHFFDQSSKFDF